MSFMSIESFEDPRVDLYRSIKDKHLRARQGLFVVEGRENLRCMLESSSYTPISILVSPPAYDALRDVLGQVDASIPIYCVPGPIMRELAGFDLHRGCLALGVRPEAENVSDFIQRLPPRPTASCVVVLENLGNHDNVGGLFRSARALGADAVVMCPRSCDPLYRKAIRVSMGASLCLPWVRDPDWPGSLEQLRQAGYHSVALDPGGEPLSHQSRWPSRVALILGTEGDGLSRDLLSAADFRRAIPMAAAVDSLNVTVAGGIALHAWRDSLSAQKEDL